MSTTTGDADYLRQRRLMVPVHGIAPSQVRDDFNARRGSRRHNALDIMAPRGTPVLATDDGRVLAMRRNSAGGITIYVADAQERMVYYYAHLDGYRRRLSEGDRVKKGDVLGYVGTTGNAPSNAPHLHFQALRLDDARRYWDGPPVNPHPYLVIEGRKRD
ncbi:MAG TPA: M23 family metallopeptidase [Gemmatimonadaceae bacterium]|nr:M23 family metallopeptidase [Gemmatimonadaceae bacterium]